MKGPLWALVACVVGIGLAATPAFLQAWEKSSSPEDENDLVVGVASTSGSRAPRYDRPAWNVGDSWAVSFDGYDPCRVVVASVDDSGYRQGWWCSEEGSADYIATQASAFDLIYAGRLTPDLAGRYGDDGVFPWFDWPLADGKTWTADVYDYTVDITARWDADDGRYVMTATLDGEGWAAWDYDPAIEWWTEMTYASGWTFAVSDRVTGWDEQITLADTTLRYEDGSSQIVVGYSAPGTFVASADDEALYFWITRGGGLYGEHVQIYAPDGTRMYQNNLASNIGGNDGDFAGGLMPSVAGTWTVARGGVTLGYSYMRVWGVEFERLTVA